MRGPHSPAIFLLRVVNGPSFCVEREESKRGVEDVYLFLVMEPMILE